MKTEDSNKLFLLDYYKSIVKINDGYILEPVYEEDETGHVVRTKEDIANKNQNQFLKNCYRCLHVSGENCLLFTKLEGCKEHHYLPFSRVANCDAFSPIFPLNIIKNKDEMIDFIDKVSCFFNSIERYECYFGFERKWDESTGDILETVQEYYNRGGEFTHIPDKYPCVIYFGLMDFNCVRSETYDRLEWIYIGDESYENQR